MSWGEAPRSKSVEFSLFTSLVSELLTCEKEAFHIHAALFGIRSRVNMNSANQVYQERFEGLPVGFWL